MSARTSVKVAMPRFRKKTAGVTVTEVVRKVLNRSVSNPQPFGVFLFRVRKGWRMTICANSSDRFKSFLRAYPNALVGVYSDKLTVSGLMSDLEEFCSFEGDS